MSKQCHICATTLTGLQRKYCSDDCYKKNLYSKLKEQRIKRRVEPETYTTCHWHNCEKEFEPQRSKFCSRSCENKFHVTKTRRNNKSKLVQHFGGGCQRCGYNKSQAALQFHHTEDNKEFILSHKGETKSYQRLLEEASKCELLCSNCHMLHHVGDRTPKRKTVTKGAEDGFCDWPLCENALGPRKRKYCSKSCSTKPTSPRRRQRQKQKLVERAGGECIDCGYDENIQSLHFHHLNPKTKSFRISAALSKKSFEELCEEADKCVLICGNCHAERHAKQNLTATS